MFARTSLTAALVGLIVYLFPTPGGALAAQLDPQTINGAEWTEQTASTTSISPTLIKLQVLLDRAHFSPGEIDGKGGENSDKAVAAYAAAQGAEFRRHERAALAKADECL